MKEWIKNNAVGIVFGILGSIGFIGSVATQVQDMAAAYASVFWWWTAATALLGIAAGAFAAGLGKRKSEDRLASIKEAEETKRRAKAEEEATTRARIEAESKAEIERVRNERADLEREEERTRVEAAKKRKRDDLEALIARLPDQEASLLSSIIKGGGTIELPRSNAPSLALEDSGLLVKLAAPSGRAVHVWKVPDGIRSIYDESEHVRASLDEAQRRVDGEKDAEKAKRMRREFERLCFDDQQFIYRLWKYKAIEGTQDLFWNLRCDDFVKFDKIGPYQLKAYLPPAKIRFFEENEDLFRHVRKYEEHE